MGACLCRLLCGRRRAPASPYKKLDIDVEAGAATEGANSDDDEEWDDFDAVAASAQKRTHRGTRFFSFFEGEKNMSPFTTAKIQDQFFSYLNFFSLVFFFFRKRSIDEDTRMTFTNHQFRLFLLLSFEKQTKQRRFVGGDDETGRSRAAGIYHSGVHVRDVRIVPN